MSERRLTVIIVEDDPHNRHAIRELVRSRDELDLVFEATDGAVAIEFIRSSLPELAFIDIDLPVRSGLRVAEAAVAAGCLVVFTTGLSSHALTAYQLGAVDYLLKPLDASRFNRAVDRSLVMRSVAGKQTAGQGKEHAVLCEVLRDSYSLTPAELDLARIIAGGCPKELLEERSGKSGRVIKSHLQSIYRKTVNEDPRAANAGRGDKFGRLVYFLFALKERRGT
jgi:DNA-binding NarL/FixJ family response regulator